MEHSLKAWILLVTMETNLTRLIKKSVSETHYQSIKTVSLLVNRLCLLTCHLF